MPPRDDFDTRLPIRLADDDRKRKNDQSGPGTAVITKTRPQTKRPNLYRVLLPAQHTYGSATSHTFVINGT